MMCSKKENDDDINRSTKECLPLPRFLGDEGKCKEISSVFATLLARRCYQGNEGQGTVQNYWLDSIEQIVKEEGVDTYEFNDAVPRNVLMDIQGNLYFIDLQINNPQRLNQYLEDFKKLKQR